MNTTMRTILSILCIVFLLNVSSAQIASSPGIEPGAGNPVQGSSAPTSFRINNKVYLEKDKTPTSSTVTMFYKGRVYDFLTNPDETIIYDPEMQRFLIISSATQTQCSITVTEMASFERMMKEALPKIKDEFIRTCLDPQFEIKQDPETNEWIYDSPKLTYRIKTIPEQYEGQAQAYADFANRYAILNVILSPQSMPPLARMEVNNDLAKKRLLPEEIHITLQPKYKPLSMSKGKETIRTTHTIIKGLGNADMNQIRQAGERYGRYKQVSFDQYQKKLKETLGE